MLRLALSAVLAGCAAGALAEETPTLFRNLSSKTVVSLRLSHAGSGEYGDNVAVGYADGVGHDGRVIIAGLPSGRYDLELRFKGGRVCFLRHIEIAAGTSFSLDDRALTACVKL